MLPSHVPFPRRLTVPGIEAVSISSTLFRIPSGVRNPTMILGTPRRNDWIQNFINFRSKVIMSRSFRMSALVFNSTQLIGPSSVGLISHTETCQLRQIFEVYLRTCIYFPTQNHDRIADSCLHDRTILSMIVHDLILSILNILSGGLVPCTG